MNTLNKDYELQCYFCPFCRPIMCGSASDQENMTPYPNPAIGQLAIIE